MSVSQNLPKATFHLQSRKSHESVSKMKTKKKPKLFSYILQQVQRAVNQLSPILWGFIQPAFGAKLKLEAHELELIAATRWRRRFLRGTKKLSRNSNRRFCRSKFQPASRSDLFRSTHCNPLLFCHISEQLTGYHSIFSFMTEPIVPQIRFVMKSYSFVRETAPVVMRTSATDGTVP